MEENVSVVTMDLIDGYKFLVDFQTPGVALLLIDEPPPLGAGEGPNASRLLAAAVGNCLSASALFCLRKARVDVRSMRTRVETELGRNEQGRLRVQRISVRLEPEIAEEDLPRAKRCLDIFEDYCVVTASVRGGVEVTAEVQPRVGLPAVA